MNYLVQLEPIEKRYTEQWSRWIPEALLGAGIPFEEVHGDKLTDTIEVGDVLDVYGTNYWKSSQIQKLILKIRRGEVKDGDVIWFADLWFPGIEALAYIRDITRIQFKIRGVLHAGTWDVMDFTTRYGMGKWAKGFEQTLFRISDQIHLGSQFHKEIILADLPEDLREEADEKMVVTGLFFDDREVRGNRDITKKSSNLVVFPHRLAPEKNPEGFDALAKEFPEFQFIKTQEVTSNKSEYYDLLAQATYAIAFKGQETFGYAILECMALGVIPLVFDGMSYQETVPSELRWTTLDELRQMLRGRKEFNSDITDYAKIYRQETIVKKMFI